jgi:gas vesicle protein
MLVFVQRTAIKAATIKLMNKTTLPAAGSGLAFGFMAGLSAGAILGILFAPKTGDQTRRELRDKAMAARERIQSQMDEKKTRLKRAAEEAADIPKEALHKAETISDTAKGKDSTRSG